MLTTKGGEGTFWEQADVVLTAQKNNFYLFIMIYCSDGICSEVSKKPKGPRMKKMYWLWQKTIKTEVETLKAMSNNLQQNM